VDAERFVRAVAEIDRANSDDPNRIMVRGELRAKELAHAELATQWVRRLEPEPSEALLLAARAHHVRRWMSPRSSQPAGRVGYLRWRRALHQLHAEAVGQILKRTGYDDDMIERVQRIVAKRDLGNDKDVQLLEDALCLVFIETQFDDLRRRLDREKMVDVVRKTLHKMSDEAITLALTIEIDDEDRALILEAAADDGESES
jgi:Domain of unknown function (DUF4202)